MIFMTLNIIIIIIIIISLQELHDIMKANNVILKNFPNKIVSQLQKERENTVLKMSSRFSCHEIVLLEFNRI